MYMFYKIQKSGQIKHIRPFSNEVTQKNIPYHYEEILYFKHFTYIINGFSKIIFLKFIYETMKLQLS